jgi:hypothetical protein
MPGTYDLGDTVDIDVLLSDPDTGNGIVVADLVCHVQPPSGAVVPVSPVTQVSAGGVGVPSRYRARFASTIVGEHWAQFTSATLGLVRESAFMVRASNVS